MARPKKEPREARAVVLGLRLTRDERAALDSRAALCGTCVADYARTAVLGGALHVTARAAPSRRSAEPSQVVALNRIGVNLNQIARTLNSGGGVVPDDLADTLARVNALLDDWQDLAA